jgi:hypothetical protein
MLCIQCGIGLFRVSHGMHGKHGKMQKPLLHAQELCTSAIKYSLTVAALLFLTASYGQDFLVTIKSDTIRGEVRIMSYDLMDRVQIADGQKKTTFTAVQLRRASMKGELYAPVKYDNSIRMMKVLRSGFLSLYAFRVSNQVTYDGRLLVKMGNPPQEVPNIGFKRYVGAIVEDCPVVGDRVKSGDLDRSNIQDLVDAYNQCVAETQEKRFQSATQNVSNPTIDFIEELRTRVNASDLPTKTEVNDLLTSITDKVKRKESVPAYMKEGLKGYLAQRDEFKEDAEQLILLLDK